MRTCGSSLGPTAGGPGPRLCPSVANIDYLRVSPTLLAKEISVLHSPLSLEGQKARVWGVWWMWGLGAPWMWGEGCLVLSGCGLWNSTGVWPAWDLQHSEQPCRPLGGTRAPRLGFGAPVLHFCSCAVAQVSLIAGLGERTMCAFAISPNVWLLELFPQGAQSWGLFAPAPSVVQAWLVCGWHGGVSQYCKGPRVSRVLGTGWDPVLFHSKPRQPFPQRQTRKQRRTPSTCPRHPRNCPSKPGTSVAPLL